MALKLKTCLGQWPGTGLREGLPVSERQGSVSGPEAQFQQKYTSAIVGQNSPGLCRVQLTGTFRSWSLNSTPVKLGSQTCLCKDQSLSRMRINPQIT